MSSSPIERAVFLGLGPRSLRHVRPVRQEAAQGLVKDVYEQMQRDFVLAPPISVHAPEPRLLAGVWAAGRESLIAGPADRAAREAVAGAVSRANACPFCVDVHGMMLHGAGEHATARAIARGGADGVPDKALRDLVAWGSATRTPGAPILERPPFSLRDAPQFFGTAIGFHYINRIVNVLLEPSPVPLPGALGFLMPAIRRLAGSLVTRRVVAIRPGPGESLALLPETPLPADLSWAASNPCVAGAFARLAAAVEQAGARVIPDGARALLFERITAWSGEEPPAGRGWVEGAVVRLSERDRPCARLALLTALASRRVDDAVVREFRALTPGDDDLVAAVSWAAFTAARRIGTWLRLPRE